jgi:hypothetical protein
MTPDWVSDLLSKTLKGLLLEPASAPPILIQVGSRAMRDKHRRRLVTINQVGKLHIETSKRRKDI